MYQLTSVSNGRYSDIILSLSCRSAFTDNLAQSIYNHEEHHPTHKKTPTAADFEAFSKATSKHYRMPFFAGAGGIPWEEIENPNEECASENQTSNGKKYFSGSTLRRCRSSLNQLITANLCGNLKFITLTYNNENLPDNFETALNGFQNFQERLTRYFQPNGDGTAGNKKAVKILGIPEKGEKNGRLHWHCIIVCPYIKASVLAREVWGKGNVDIKSLKMKSPDETAKQISNYVTKYLSKGVEKWEGRTRIYYATKNWNSTKKVALLSEKQGRKCFDYLKFCEKNNVCSSPFISLTNFDGSKIDEFEREAFIKRCRLPQKLKELPADYISFRWRLPRKAADNFVKFAESLFVDFQDKKILGKTQKERDTDAKIRLQNRAFRETMFDRSKIEYYTAELARAFPHVNAGYIYGVLKHQNRYLDRDLQPNNFYLMNKFADKIDLATSTFPKLLKKQMTIFLKRDESVLASTRWKFLRKLRYSDVLSEREENIF